MKVLQIQTQAEAGGAQRISDEVGKGLREKGHEVHTVFLYRKTAAFDDDLHSDAMLDHAPRSAMDYARAIFRAIKRARREKPDVIIGYQHYGNLVGVLCATAARRPLIANQNAMPDGVGVPRLAMKADKFVGAFGGYRFNVFNAQETLRAFSRYPARYMSRAVMIEHGVCDLSSDLPKKRARQMLGLPVDARIILNAGRLSAQKGQDIAIRTLGNVPNAVLVIAGDGPLRGDLEALAKRLGLADRTIFLGELPPAAMPTLLRAGDAFLFTTLWETFGLAVVEATMAGIPTVCSDLPILREVLTYKGEEGALFFPVGDADRAGDLLRGLLDSPDHALQLSKAGVRTTARYSLDAMIDGYDALIQRLGEKSLA